MSVDDHVVEPPHLFERWLPKKFADHPDKPAHDASTVESLAGVLESRN